MRLRVLEETDLDAVFAWEQDAAATAMAAFTRTDPSDRAAFDAHHKRIRNDPACTLLAIEDGATLVGTIGSYTMEGDREVTYWIDTAHWGRGLGSRALREFLQVEATRPLHARVAEHNVGSATVLTRAGFAFVGTATGYAAGVGREVVEHLYRLDP